MSNQSENDPSLIPVLNVASCSRTGESSSRRNSVVKSPVTEADAITVKDLFDFMKTAYQVYEHLEKDEEEGNRINWEELTKLTVINHVLDPHDRELLQQTEFAEKRAIVSKSDTTIIRECERDNTTTYPIQKRYSCSDMENIITYSRCGTLENCKIEMLGVWTEANLNCKLNGVINEGILDSILPYLVGYKKVTKTQSVFTPIIKKTGNDVKKLSSFNGFMTEKESKDRLGRRRSSIIAAQERLKQRQEGDVDIHVCDEVKGLKKDFRCPQKLLVGKMGYFADVTAGQRLEDMDISVHCDIQIFDWLMRWVKRDSILVADWPLLEPANVVPILVSASFLQMEPLLHDCLIYCHAHMNDIVKTNTNLACLSDALLTRLAAMYTNTELEAIKDRRDKIQSRLYCKMILSLGEPVPETLRGHYASLATLLKCSKCNKLLGRHIAEQVPCQPASMRIDRRGNVVSNHTRDTSWCLNEYISWLWGELRSWRRVYWRLWAECHFLKCQMCHSYFPIYQMEWCSYHESGAVMFGSENCTPLPAGKYPCCGERAYRFDTVTRNTGCQFREHIPDDHLAFDAAVLEIYNQHRELVAMRPPALVFPERITRLVAKDQGDAAQGRLQCTEVFWWSGIQLAPPRAPLGLLGSLYSSDSKFNPFARPGSPVEITKSVPSFPTLAANISAGAVAVTEVSEMKGDSAAVGVVKNETSAALKKGASQLRSMDSVDEQSSEESSDDSVACEVSDASEEETVATSKRAVVRSGSLTHKKRNRIVCRQWIPSLSARSNQDGQRRFEERAARQMRAALVKRAAGNATRSPAPPGGIYARLETEWRDRHTTRRPPVSARPRMLRGK